MALTNFFPLLHRASLPTDGSASSRQQLGGKQTMATAATIQCKVMELMVAPSANA
jgi:hypothetical protein